MKLHLARPTDRNAFTGYGPGYVLINGVRHESSLVVLPDRLLESWGPASAEGLEATHFEVLATLGVEIVLLGTGTTMRFPHPRVTVPLAAARVGLEVMDTQAACRTYNILMGEERRVAAALLI